MAPSARTHRNSQARSRRVYGQNLRGAPEQHWEHGYAFSWALIIVTTLLQFSYFRHKKWI